MNQMGNPTSTEIRNRALEYLLLQEELNKFHAKNEVIAQRLSEINMPNHYKPLKNCVSIIIKCLGCQKNIENDESVLIVKGLSKGEEVYCLECEAHDLYKKIFDSIQNGRPSSPFLCHSCRNSHNQSIKIISKNEVEIGCSLCNKNGIKQPLKISLIDKYDLVGKAFFR